MPAGTGKKVVVAALCPADIAEQAKQGGADLIDREVILEQVSIWVMVDQKQQD